MNGALLRSSAMALALTSAGIAGEAQETGLALVSDGKAKALIVVADAPSPAAIEASKILGDHLAQMSGATLRTVAESELPAAKVEGGRIVSPAADVFLLVGQGKMAAALGVTAEGLGPGGACVKSVGNAVVLLGPDAATPTDPWGTRNAVTTFLEDALGVRYLWPGESGKVVPRRRTIVVPPMDISCTPRLRQRQIRSMPYHDRLQVGLDRLKFTKDDYLKARAGAEATTAASGGWFAWQRMGGTLDLVSGHAFGYVWQKYGAEHPEWFALQLNGSRDQSKLGPDRARLCKSNAQLIEAIANDKLEEIRGRVAAGRTPAASVGPNDGGRAGFCTCDECKKLDPPEGRKITLWDFSGGARKDYEYVSLTDRVVFFWNGIAERVAREFPDALLTADGYSAYQAPPVKREFHPNLVVRFAGIGYGSDAGRRTGLDDWNGWAAKAKKMYWRPNLLLAGRRDGLPFIYIHKLAQDFRYLADHGMIGTDFDSCVHNWATQGLNYYVCAKLHWRPDLDVDALIDDYCRAGFGAAAAEVKAYFARLEALLDQAAAKEASFVDHLMPDVLGELRRLLDDARAKAAGDEDARRRVDFLRVGFDFTEVQAEVYAMLAKARAGEKPEKARVDALMDRKYAMMRDIFDRNNLAVNVAYCCWGEWGYFGQLGWTGPTQKAVKPVIDADEAGKPVKEAR